MSFPEAGDRELQSAAESALDYVTKVDSWIADYGHSRIHGKNSIPDSTQYEILERRRSLADLKAASCMPIAVAVYGASQSGKSLLVGRLVRGSAGQSALGFSPGDAANNSLDFIEHLNPAPGVEATAVVTRFSLADRVPASGEQKCPVRARLFSRSDILKSLGRGFVMECESEVTWTIDSLKEFFEEELSTERATSVDSDWRADIVEAYRFLKLSIGSHRLTMVPSEFSQFLVSRPLTEKGYRKLAAGLFWDGWDKLTNLFSDILSLRQEKLGAVDWVYCSWEAVRFILDSTLPDEIPAGPFGRAPKWDNNRLEIDNTQALVTSGKSGEKVELYLLQAIIAEIQIPLIRENLPEVSQSLFDVSDFLDIPGAVEAAGRSKISLSQQGDTFDADSPIELRILKRGKVGFLFEKYADEHQSNVLLYLQASGNFSARSELPPQISSWGKIRFGEDWPDSMPDNPEASQPSIFVALTKIDLLLRLEKSAMVFTELIKTQLAANFASWMGNYGSPGKKFKNLFLLRYPGIIDEETPDQAISNISDWREKFLSSVAVKSYVADAGQRWDEALGPDGGLGLLLSNILEKLDANERRRLLYSRIKDNVESVRAMISGFYVDPNIEVQARTRLQTASNIVSALQQDQYGLLVRAVVESFHCEEQIIYEALSSGEPPADAPVPLPPDFRLIVQKIVDDWANTRRWDARKLRHTSTYLSDAEITKLAHFVADYLKAICIDEMATRLEDLHQSVADDSGNSTFGRYTRLIIDDYVLTPGPRLPRRSRDELAANKPFSSLAHRWGQILGSRLASAVSADGFELPDGNDVLGELLSITWESKEQ